MAGVPISCFNNTFFIAVMHQCLLNLNPLLNYVVRENPYQPNMAFTFLVYTWRQQLPGCEQSHGFNVFCLGRLSLSDTSTLHVLALLGAGAIERSYHPTPPGTVRRKVRWTPR